GGVVHRVGVPVRIADVALVLDADRVRVVRAHVPGLLAFADHLGDLAVGAADQVVGADLGARVLEPGDRAGIAALHRVDGHFAHGGAAARGVVRRVHPARTGEVDRGKACVPGSG